MRVVLKQVYDWRSKALHAGISFPLPMCIPPQEEGGSHWEKPIGLGMSTGTAVWRAGDTPILLHAFEYIVRESLLGWWRSLSPKPDNSNMSI